MGICQTLGLVQKTCFAYQNWPNDPCVGIKRMFKGYGEIC